MTLDELNATTVKVTEQLGPVNDKITACNLDKSAWLKCPASDKKTATIRDINRRLSRWYFARDKLFAELREIEEKTSAIREAIRMEEERKEEARELAERRAKIEKEQLTREANRAKWLPKARYDRQGRPR